MLRSSEPAFSFKGRARRERTCPRMEFSAKSERITVAQTRRFGRGFAVEYDAFRVRIEGCTALDLFGEMELDARFFLLGSLEKAQASQVECHAAR